MIYTVIWIPSARDELARIWMRAADRQAVTDAADQIDAILRIDPDKKGRPFKARRLLIVPPLAVTFTVSEEDRLVRVLQVFYLNP